MKKLFSFLAVAALFALPVFAGEFPDVTIPEVKAAMASGKATIIDVNGTDSYKAGHVPGALNYADISSNLSSALPKDKGALIIAYCGGPSCNAYVKAATAAAKLGYTNVKHMPAGISGWMQAGEKTDK
jgi:rhodanese-related sulfurtransferase